jgi:hypothetical protein
MMSPLGSPIKGQHSNGNFLNAVCSNPQTNQKPSNFKERKTFRDGKASHIDNNQGTGPGCGGDTAARINIVHNGMTYINQKIFQNVNNEYFPQSDGVPRSEELSEISENCIGLGQHGELRNSKSCIIGKIAGGSSGREIEFCGKVKMIKCEEGVLNINRILALGDASPLINERRASNRKLALESVSPLIHEKTASRRKKSGTSWKNRSFGSPNEIFMSKSE